MIEAKHRLVLMMDDESFNKLQSAFKLAQTLEEYKEASMGTFIVDAMEGWMEVIGIVAEMRQRDFGMN